MNLSGKALLGLLLVAFGAGILVASFGGVSPTAWVSLPRSSDSTLTSSFSSIQSAFCPSPSCVSLPVSAMDTTHARVWVAMYSFTHPGLRDALIRAHDRGVDVRVLLESQQASSKYSVHSDLVKAGIPVKLDTNPQLMHNKFAVLDDSMIITGSMNWTQNGVTENNENVNVIQSPEENALYASEFQSLWETGAPVGGS